MGKYLRFLSAGGEMGSRIREADWSDSPFGPPQGWPQSLRSTLGICLRSSIPTCIYWGEELRLLYNDAWSFIPGPRHPAALGKPAREVWPDIWHIIEPQFQSVYDSREGFSTTEQLLEMQRFGHVEETYWDYSFTPIIGEDGDIVGILNQGQEVTQDVLQRRRAEMLLALDRAVRPLTAADEILDSALGLLATGIPAERIGYGEIDTEADTISVARCWTDGSMAHVSGTHPLAFFGSELGGQARTGEVVRIDDMESDPATAEPGVRERFRAIGLRSGLVVPAAGRAGTKAAIFAHASQPRSWHDHHVELLQAFGKRVREALFRARMETELQDSERRFRLIFEQAHDIIFTATIDQRITACNPAACAALELEAEEIIGRSIADFMPEKDFRRTRQMLRHKLDKGGTTNYDVTVIGASGREMHWEINSTLATDSEGHLIGLHAIARDITERRAFEERQKLLINELNHRVKNTLALVQGLALQTFREGREPADARAAFEERLVALAAAHDLLTREKWEGATLATLIDDSMRAVNRGNERRVTASGGHVQLPPKAAVSLAMAVHELATNAAKYGALSNPDGTVTIGWHVEGDRLRIDWRESGGPKVEKPTRKGFGTRMIERALAADLGGEIRLDFAPEGLCCSIDVPLPGMDMDTAEAAE
ncbi:PAS domain-containing sensor histidine kinase [Parasphingopyxis marina]|uniref:histidine kinase n=1 Tax=Parasphingopyxis marina TaxID=2761622 RepID=A0A842HX80_9SPHN|nr:HWE histidine kinase domain-containing protein [Parasphingopyxis marina]MBC2776550.1 PAS domain-containing protein [Parasphingopyxis marina]